MKPICLDTQVVSAHIHPSGDDVFKIPEKELIEVAEAILYELSSDDCRFEILYESDAFQYKGTCTIENRHGRTFVRLNVFE